MKSSLLILLLVVWLGFHTAGCRAPSAVIHGPLTEAEAKTMVADYVRTTMMAQSFGLYDVELVTVNSPTIDGDTATVEFRTKKTLKSNFGKKLRVRTMVYDAQATFKLKTLDGWRLVKVDEGQAKVELSEETKSLFEGRERLMRNALYGRFEPFIDQVAALPLANRQQLSALLKQFSEAKLEEKRLLSAQLRSTTPSSEVAGDLMFWSYDSLTDEQKFTVQSQLNR